MHTSTRRSVLVLLGATLCGAGPTGAQAPVAPPAPAGTNVAAIAAAAAAAPGAGRIEFVPPSHQWRVSGGALYRTFDRVGFRSGAYSTAGAVPRLFPGGHGVDYGPVGPADAYADRQYDNGFVRLDSGTTLNGDTWYWGYDAAAQVGGGSLTFQRAMGTEARSDARSLAEPYAWEDDTLAAPGVFVEAERCFSQIGGVDLGLLLNGAWSAFDAEHAGTSFSAEQRYHEEAVALTDRYELLGVVPPAAPYGTATYDGPGPLLPNLPAARTSSAATVSDGAASFVNRVSEAVDLDVLTLALAASASREFGRVALELAAGPSLSLVLADATFHEVLTGTRGGRTFTVNEWTASDSREAWQWGVFGQAGLNVAVTGRLRLGVFGRYDWVEDVEGRVGPSSYTAELSGVSGGVVLGWVN